MKLLPRTLLCSCLTALLSVAAGAQSTAELLSSAQAAYRKGDKQAAKRDFEMVYRLDPRNEVAISFLRLLKTDPAANKMPAQGEQKFRALIIAQVQYREATLSSVLDALKQQANKLSGGKTPVNFVCQLPPETLNSTLITLSLNDVPLTEVLRYVGDLARIDFTYEQFAIVARPRQAVVATQPAASDRAVGSDQSVKAQ